MKQESTKEFLLSALKNQGIEAISHDAKTVNMKMNYVIEIENENLFKLTQDNHVRYRPFCRCRRTMQFYQNGHATP